jgi:hypothetical protein
MRPVKITPLVFRLALLSALSMLPGCGSPAGQVEGTVTLNQKPVADAEFLFESTADAHEQFFGTSNIDGWFTVSYRTKKGMPVGTYRVIVTQHTLKKGTMPTGEHAAILKGQGATVKVCHAFERTIAAGMNNLRFELSEGTKVPCR